MQVILREDVKGLGKRGQVVRVADGYARNFLFPRGLAEDTTAGKMKQVEAERRRTLEKQDRLEQEARELAARISETRVQLQLRVGDNGKPFGSITAQHVADALAALGLEVDRRRIELKSPIRALGEHVVEVRPHARVTARLVVEVRPE
ncbi:MAG: 50S ribosomal protein L9 [Thermaerobacter sp.]|nr:50S ribosomal protein L9 [Thermaerobacter sp.]